MMVLNSLFLGKIMVKLRLKITFVLICLGMKMAWRIQFIYQVKNSRLYGFVINKE